MMGYREKICNSTTARRQRRWIDFGGSFGPDGRIASAGPVSARAYFFETGCIRRAQAEMPSETQRNASTAMSPSIT
jgi:hypothetical protein